MRYVDRVIEIDLRSLGAGCVEEKENFSEKITFVLREIDKSKRFGSSYGAVYNVNRSTVSCLILSIMGFSETEMNHLAPDSEVVATNEAMVYLLTTATGRKYQRINLVDLFLLGADIEPGSVSLDASPFREKPGGPEKILREVEKCRKEGSRIAALQIGAGTENRRWPIANFAEVISFLKRRDWEVLVVGSKEERENASKLKEGSKLSFLDATGKTSLTELAHLLSKCDLLITNDTGTMHLGASLGVKIISIFLSTASPQQTGPYGKGHIVIHPLLDCYPCVEKGGCEEQKCRDSIRPEDVFYALGGEPTGNRNVRMYVTDITKEGFELLPLDRGAYDLDYLTGKILKKALLFLISHPRFPLPEKLSFSIPELTVEGSPEGLKICKEISKLERLRSELEKVRRKGKISLTDMNDDGVTGIFAAFFLHSNKEAVRGGSFSKLWARKRVIEFLKAVDFVRTNLGQLLQHLGEERKVS
jgi:hypothetical protein